MTRKRGTLRTFSIAALAASLLTGCLSTSPSVPQGYRPALGVSPDERTATLLMPDLARAPAPVLPTLPAPRPDDKKDEKKAGKAFELPAALPGVTTPPVKLPQFAKDTPPAERLRLVREAYPSLTPVGAIEVPAAEPLSLADLQRLAMSNSPVIKRASADVQVAYGQMVQAGLHPNPTVGYEADQWQPGPNPAKNNSGQQGAYLNQLIKFPGKLSLAQAVVGFDYVNAYVAVRRAEVDVTAAVRSNFFQVLIARKAIEVNRALVAMADEVYQLQLRQLAAGEAAGYEPLQLYAQALQARTALAQAEANYRANWRQLAAAIGQPDLAPAPLTGSIDLAVPVVDPTGARLRIAEAHTDLLSARNRVLQAQTDLRLQRLNRAPDLVTNTVVQYDNAAKNNQFNLQLGVPVPLYDRNQGNIRAAQGRIASATAGLAVAENDLLSRLADATGRYDANRAAVTNYRDKILPALTQAYGLLIRRYQQEPADLPAGGKVGFNDIVVAQQNLSQALQSYLSALGTQWQSVVDLANLLQVDELYSGVPPAPKPPEAPDAEKK